MDWNAGEGDKPTYIELLVLVPTLVVGPSALAAKLRMIRRTNSHDVRSKICRSPYLTLGEDIHKGTNKKRPTTTKTTTLNALLGGENGSDR